MKKQLSPTQREALLRALKARFENNLNRHKTLDWAKVQARLEAQAEKLWSLHEMEKTGGEPNVVSWCDQNRTALCDQKRTNPQNLGLAVALHLAALILGAASAEDRALRGRNPSAV